MALGPRADQALIGTLDGSLITYDFRYNVQASYCSYTKDASIMNIQAFYPNKYRKFSLNNANYMSPLAFIATSDGQVSLIDLSDKDTDLMETQLVLISRSGESKDKQIGCFKQKENVHTKLSLTQSILSSVSQSITSSRAYVMPKKRERLENIIKNYEPNAMSSLLCPKHCKYKYSASFLIGGDTQGRIRYWDIERGSNKRTHFYLGNNEEVSYRRIKIDNAINVISDKVKTSKGAKKLTSDFEDFEIEEETDEPFENPDFPEEAHTGAINALGMLYVPDEQR